MLIDLQRARDSLLQTVRVYIICLAVVSGLSVIVVLYLGLRYGWTSVWRGLSYEDAKSWLIAIVSVPCFPAGAYLLSKFLEWSWARLARRGRQ